MLNLWNPDGSRYPMYDWCIFQPGHPLSLTPRPHQARPEKTRPHQSKPGYPGQQSLFRLDFNPQNILFLQTFAVSAIQFPSCWCLLSITIWRCKVFYKSLCTRYLPHSLCFLSEKIHWFSTDWNRHWETLGKTCLWWMGHHNEIFWREIDCRKLRGKSGNAHFVRQLTNPGWLPWRVIVVSGKSTTGSPHFISLCYFARNAIHLHYYGN